MVERNLAKVEVAGSNPVSRSILRSAEAELRMAQPSVFCTDDQVKEIYYLVKYSFGPRWRNW